MTDNTKANIIGALAAFGVYSLGKFQGYQKGIVDAFKSIPEEIRPETLEVVKKHGKRAYTKFIVKK